ncbi:MAG: hypothetical protein AB2417_06470 [Clostridiaceae bacterium]
MKKINKILSSLMICFGIITIVSGCGKSNLKNTEVEKLQSDLITMAEENSEKYFTKKLNTKDFDISFAKEVKENEYENIKSLDGVKKVYMIGHFNGKPSDIIEFNLIYDVESKKIIKFGLRTLKDDNIVYANLKE